MDNPLILIKNLQKIYDDKNLLFSPKKEPNHVLKDVSMDIKKGEIVSLVGESGCGKSTLANCILKLVDVQSGEILYNGENILDFNKRQTFNYRKKIQMVFQNPYSSLNPKMKIKDTLEEPMLIHRIANKKSRLERINEIIDLVGISHDDLKKYPHEFSGGQRQRIAIARALILTPKSPTSPKPPTVPCG